ncbi:MAG: MoxR family ATPase [Deltaproteobacteria bacterium]
MGKKLKKFKDVDHVAASLEAADYICSKTIATVVFLAQATRKPVLVEGPAGVGKTELSKAVARSLDRKLIRLQCYEGLDETKALYEWEYAKQLLYTQMVKEKIDDVVSGARNLPEAVDRIAAQEDAFFTARNIPFVFLTSNDSRDMSDALKRRCIHLYIDYPDRDLEMRIVRLKIPGIKDRLAGHLIDAIHKIRDLDLKKKPCVSETLDWAQALIALQIEELSPEVIGDTLNVILKYQADADLVGDKLDQIIH